ncbi:uncharacterized protein C8Q71DRAFT_229820 [Rhodofomes roseus]|uniref:Uncharacterized protein n=1 Tax=Rhodofomes roseus TaxID=34475 RepID=A0ABQ8KV71_9APHY|nr:uncharacterized protein C8Q71DRAFT_229820 [Rhodofomes roseus]KAH9842977.1 hypothetical protein C8Q71DRAFT_229820 [Rhodofomes roseus]
MPIVVDLHALYVKLVFTVPPDPFGYGIGWIKNPSKNTMIGDILFFVGEACSSIPELLVAVATWRRTYHSAKLAKSQQISTSLTTLLLRDGTLYFITILALVIVDIILSATAYPIGASLVPIMMSLQTVLLSRFYLNLNRANFSPSDGPPSGDASEASDLRFTRVVGSLAGTDVDFDPDPEPEEEEMEERDLEYSGAQSDSIVAPANSESRRELDSAVI